MKHNYNGGREVLQGQVLASASEQVFLRQLTLNKIVILNCLWHGKTP